ncbi:MAG TPA: GGDEF domain-containing protein [Gammaproteobacteria bacterium]|nr:GGDEF domain-containing protein [Gammaproteobacteria bacterium]
MSLNNLRIQPRRRCSTIQVIDSLAEVTRFLDKELIEQSLISTLSEFEPRQELRLYKVLGIGDEVELALSALYRDGVISFGNERSVPQMEEGLAQLIEEVVEQGELVTVTDPEDGRMVSIYPVFAQDGELYSLLVQISPPIGIEDQRLINGLLRVYSNYLSLLDLSQRDKLTSLLNRDRLQTTIMQILGDLRLAHGGTPRTLRRATDSLKHWLAMIDIDHFKRVNDRHGHLMGDEILIIFARLMHEVFRNDDLLFRFGGEEFVVVIQADDEEKAGRAFERFRERVEAHEFPLVGHLTASLGVTEIEGRATPEQVLEAADRALYWVKQHGRNGVAFHHQLVARGELEPLHAPQAGEIDLF